MTMHKGSVLKVGKSAGGGFNVKVDQLEPPPPGERVLPVEEWAYGEFKDAMLHGKSVEWTEDGGQVTTVTIVA